MKVSLLSSIQFRMGLKDVQFCQNFFINIIDLTIDVLERR